MTVGGSDEFRASFFEECEELLEAMHDGFGQMQTRTDDAETIHVVFRAVHSIKGGAGAFGLESLVAFAHHFETVLDRMRAGSVETSCELLDALQHSGDHLSDLVAAARDYQPVDDTKAAALEEQLRAIAGLEPVAAEPPEAGDPGDGFEPLSLDLGAIGGPDLPDLPDSQTAGPGGHELIFSAEPELFSSGNEPAHLLRALNRFGSTSVSADISEVVELSRLDPSMSGICWTVRIETNASEAVLRDVFDFVSDCAELEFRPLLPVGSDQMPVTADYSEAAAPEAPPPDPAPACAGSPPPTASDKGMTQEAATANPVAGAATKPKAAAPQTIRVDFERVDKLINLVGELVIKEAMLSQAVGALGLSTGDVLQELDGLKQLAGEIQEGVMAIRAQPVKPLFQRMARTIRDACAMTGKRVNLLMKGETAEIDKTVLERLVDPLNHMVRNAVDHGLEDTESRLDAGKPAEGTVTLSAAHRSGRVVIEISDDGGGIDREKVRKLAVDKGLIAPDATLGPSEIDALLFMPGFSSKSEVSELSGRGVGLDVVRSEITALGGRMSISSEVGKGTVFSISLPLTLAVLEGMVVDVAGQTMVVPITAIQETVQFEAASIHTIGSGSQVLSIRDSLVPLADLGALFGFRAPPQDLSGLVLLVIETETEKRCALIVDGLQDQRQVVIKSLETNYSQVDGIAAATILGDGRIALIVDPEGVAGGLVAPSVTGTAVQVTDPDSQEGAKVVTA